MKDMMIALVVAGVYFPAIIGWLSVTDEMIYKVVDAVCDFFVKPVAPVKTNGTAGDYLAKFGEAVDA